jgi:two-component system sensor histidine kinase/response regulator
VRKPLKEHIIFDKIAEYLNVNYIYADEPSRYSEIQDLLMSQGRNNKITSGDLAKIIPQEWLLQLREAALEVDDDRILQLISEIPSIYADSANELIRLVRQFCFDEILELTQPNIYCL